MEQAVETGATALFGEKYGDTVRVVQMDNASVELCGGTHVKQIGEIGLFKITSESGVAAGVRRVEAVSGETALDKIDQEADQLDQIARALKANRKNIVAKVIQLGERTRGLEKELEQLKAKLASHTGNDLISRAVEINGIKVLSTRLDNVDRKVLRDTLDQLKSKLGSGVVVLGTAEQEKVSLIAGVTQDLTKKVKAGELVNYVAKQVGGKGGGRPDMAQAGGDNPAALDNALASVHDWIREQ